MHVILIPTIDACRSDGQLSLGCVPDYKRLPLTLFFNNNRRTLGNGYINAMTKYVDTELSVLFCKTTRQVGLQYRPIHFGILLATAFSKPEQDKIYTHIRLSTLVSL